MSPSEACESTRRLSPGCKETHRAIVRHGEHRRGIGRIYPEADRDVRALNLDGLPAKTQPWRNLGSLNGLQIPFIVDRRISVGYDEGLAQRIREGCRTWASSMGREGDVWGSRIPAAGIWPAACIRSPHRSRRSRETRGALARPHARVFTSRGVR